MFVFSEIQVLAVMRTDTKYNQILNKKTDKPKTE